MGSDMPIRFLSRGANCQTHLITIKDLANQISFHVDGRSPAYPWVPAKVCSQLYEQLIALDFAEGFLLAELRRSGCARATFAKAAIS